MRRVAWKDLARTIFVSGPGALWIDEAARLELHSTAAVDQQREEQGTHSRGYAALSQPAN